MRPSFVCLVLVGAVLPIYACASADGEAIDAPIGGGSDSSISDGATVVDATPGAADALADGASSIDASLIDGAVPDAMAPDAMAPDAMVPDAMVPDAGAVMCADQSIDDSLALTDPSFIRPFGDVDCVPSSEGTNVFYDVYTYQLTGPGPHQFIASTCNMALFDTAIAMYQAPGGTANPFDPAQPCLNIFKYDDDANDPGAPTCANATSYFDVFGLEAGEVQLVVTSYTNGVTGNYTVTMSSPTCIAP